MNLNTTIARFKTKNSKVPLKSELCVGLGRLQLTLAGGGGAASAALVPVPQSTHLTGGGGGGAAAVSQQGLRVERTAVVLALKLAVRLFCLWHTVPLLIDGNLRTVEI